MCCCIEWPPIAEAQKDKACFFPARSAKIVLTYFLLLSSQVQSSRTRISTVPWVQITRYNYMEGNKQKSSCFSKTSIFLCLFPCFVSGCALFIFLLLFYSPSQCPFPLTLCCVHTLFQPPLWLAWPRSADSAGSGNTLTLCPILSSPNKGHRKWDLQLHLKQSLYRTEGRWPRTVPCSPWVFFLEAYKVHGQSEMKLSVGFGWLYLLISR